MITTARVDAATARERAIEIAEIVADMAGSEVFEPEVKEGPYWPEQLEAQAAAVSEGEAPRKPSRTYKRIEKSKA